MTKKEPKTRLQRFLTESDKYKHGLNATLIMHEVQITALMDNQSRILESIEKLEKNMDSFKEAQNILMKDVAQIHDDIELHGKWIDQLGEQVY